MEMPVNLRHNNSVGLQVLGGEVIYKYADMSSLGVLVNLLPIAGGSILACQGLKFLLALRKNEVNSWRRLLQPGGMPSSHAAVVTSLATTMGLFYGFKSPFFQLAFVFGGIVIYDALTLRYAVGEHARRINMMGRKEEKGYGKELLENMGHTLTEVIVGALIGITIALLLY